MKGLVLVTCCYRACLTSSLPRLRPGSWLSTVQVLDGLRRAQATEDAQPAAARRRFEQIFRCLARTNFKTRRKQEEKPHLLENGYADFNEILASMYSARACASLIL